MNEIEKFSKLFFQTLMVTFKSSRFLKFKNLRKKEGFKMCPSLKMKEHDELHQITNIQLMNIKL
jgi:hypothetical protein